MSALDKPLDGNNYTAHKMIKAMLADPDTRALLDEPMYLATGLLGAMVWKSSLADVLARLLEGEQA